MNFKKGVLLILVVLLVGGSMLYAIDYDFSMGEGTYYCADMPGQTINLYKEYTSDGYRSKTRYSFVQYSGNTVIARGSVRIVGRGTKMEVSGDYSATWTIVNSRTFIDQGGKTWHR